MSGGYTSPQANFLSHVGIVTDIFYNNLTEDVHRHCEEELLKSRERYLRRAARR
jgi:hypothetical protein